MILSTICILKLGVCLTPSPPPRLELTGNQISRMEDSAFREIGHSLHTLVWWGLVGCAMVYYGMVQIIAVDYFTKLSSALLET